MNRLSEKKELVVALVIFVLTSALAVVINSLVGYGWDTSRSISRYVGMETWGAVIFALGNFVVAALLGKYLWKKGEVWKMPRVYYYAVLVMGVSLIWLSMCPIGYFDIDGNISVISRLHEIASRTMFAIMALIFAMIALNKNCCKLLRQGAVAYLVYVVICILGYFSKASWFVPVFLFFEASYLVGFAIILLVCEKRTIEA